MLQLPVNYKRPFLGVFSGSEFLVFTINFFFKLMIFNDLTEVLFVTVSK